jgi:hypothetical protein
MLNEWAYGAIYASSTERAPALAGWLFRYNHHRKHSALGRKPPAARLIELRNNPLGSYSAARTTSSMSPGPIQSTLWRTVQPSPRSSLSARATRCSDSAPTR